MSKGKEFTADEARMLAWEMVNRLKTGGVVDEVVVCGSLRRGKPKVKDVDLAIFTYSEDYSKVWALVPKSAKWETHGDKSRRFYYKGIKFDARVFHPIHRGAALLTRTGSARLNVIMRGAAKKQGFLLNEYGIFKDDRNLAPGWSEKQIFAFLGFDYLEPEQRSEPALKAKQEDRQEWVVPSKSGNGEYKVTLDDGELRCECKGFQYRMKCWHTDYVKEKHHESL